MGELKTLEALVEALFNGKTKGPEMESLAQTEENRLNGLESQLKLKSIKTKVKTIVLSSGKEVKEPCEPVLFENTDLFKEAAESFAYRGELRGMMGVKNRLRELILAVKEPVWPSFSVPQPKEPFKVFHYKVDLSERLSLQQLMEAALTIEAANQLAGDLKKGLKLEARSTYYSNLVKSGSTLSYVVNPEALPEMRETSTGGLEYWERVYTFEQEESVRQTHNELKALWEDSQKQVNALRSAMKSKLEALQDKADKEYKKAYDQYELELADWRNLKKDHDMANQKARQEWEKAKAELLSKLSQGGI